MYSGVDMFVLLPKGFTKSIFYQVLPFLFDHKPKKCSHESDGSVVIVIQKGTSLSSLEKHKHFLVLTSSMIEMPAAKNY